MTTLRDLKPCIDDGNIAVRRTPGSGEFIESRSGGYHYDNGVFRETYPTFDDLIEFVEGGDFVLSILEGEQILRMWDLLDDSEEEE